MASDCHEVTGGEGLTKERHSRGELWLHRGNAWLRTMTKAASPALVIETGREGGGWRGSLPSGLDGNRGGG